VSVVHLDITVNYTNEPGFIAYDWPMPARGITASTLGGFTRPCQRRSTADLWGHGHSMRTCDAGRGRKSRLVAGGSLSLGGNPETRRPPETRALGLSRLGRLVVARRRKKTNKDATYTIHRLV
jgi:hypothetical protein